MFDIKFHPVVATKKLTEETESYQKIWESNKEKVLLAFEKHTNLKFKPFLVNALVFGKGIPRSHPLLLRANEPDDIKKATLIHELGHRLMVDNQIKFKPGKNMSEEIHKVLFLFLYDVWVDLYDQKFADKAVEREKQLNNMYKNAWSYALSLSKKERQSKLTSYF